MRFSNLVPILAILLLAPLAARADLIFSAPPRGTEAEERATYEPLAKTMSAWIGKTVTYDYPGDFVTYTFRMRKGEYDIVFDGPHFVSWRVRRLHHEILVELPEPLVFNVVANAGSSDITDLDSLINKKVCGLASMQFGTLAVLSQYKLREPDLQIMKGENQVAKNLGSGHCNVAILRSNVVQQMSAAERQKVKVVYTSESYPNSAITAGPRVAETERKILIAKLSDPNSNELRSVLTRFTANSPNFVRAEPARYAGMDRMLVERIFGW